MAGIVFVLFALAGVHGAEFLVRSMGSRLNSERLDSIASRALTLAPRVL